jgi:ribose transport system permease protein
MKNKSNFINIINKYAIYLILVLLILIISAINSNFFTVSNLINILRQCSVYAILAFGMTFVVISGGIDLSGGAVISLAGCVTALMMVSCHLNMWLAVLIGILVGGLCGLLNGLAITKLRVPFFLATVAMMYSARGVALVLTNENPVSGLPSEFAIFGGTVDFPIPPQVIIAVITFIVLGIILNQTKVGRYTFAIGSNRFAAKLSGVDVNKYTIIVYTISGLCAGIAGVIMAARLKVGSPIVAAGYEMDAVAAVAIGGTSMMGGSGSIAKSAVGAMVLTVIRVGLNVLGISSSVQNIVMGVVIVAVVSIDMRKRLAR